MRGIATKRGRQEGSRKRQYHARSRQYNRSYQDERNQVCSRIRRRLVEAPQGRERHHHGEEMDDQCTRSVFYASTIIEG